MRSLVVLLALACAVAAAGRAEAYLKLGTRIGDRTVTLKWNRLPVRYFVSDAGVPGVTPTQLQQTLGRAFETWQQVPSASVTFEFVGFTAARPFEQDDMSVLGFLDRPEMDRVLGATTFLINSQTGEILESDVFFNARFPWSVAPQGEQGRFDLESVAVHEIGHMLGLGHSAIGETEMRPAGGRRVIASETVMFPIAFPAGSIDDRVLRPDDIAGVSDIYPAGGFRRQTGSLSGRVTMNGQGVMGAHIVAYHPQSGKLIGGFTLSRTGTFVIAGLEPGLHVVRVEPLDDVDIDSFFAAGTNVDLDFRVTFLARLAVVPRGGATREAEIGVAPK